MPAGRPTKRTAEIEGRLETAFGMGATVEAACFYADIPERTYYDWAKADQKFSQRMKAVKQRQILKALKTVEDDLADPKTARWFLDRKHPDFKTKNTTEVIDTEQITHIESVYVKPKEKKKSDK